MKAKLLLLVLATMTMIATTKAQCIDTLPATTVIITSDTTIADATSTHQYLICPGVNVIYTGWQSTFITYYLEDSASVEIGTYHYPQLYLKDGAEVNANHSTSPQSYLMKPTADSSAIFTDTLHAWMDTVTWCSNVVFDYSNLPGGTGCPTVTSVKTPSAPIANIFPNPTSGRTVIDFGSANTSGYHIHVANTLGQTVYQQFTLAQQHIIDLNAIAGHGGLVLVIKDSQQRLVHAEQLMLD